MGSFVSGYAKGLELMNQMKSLKQRDEEMAIMRERQAELSRHQQLALEVTKQHYSAQEEHAKKQEELSARGMDIQSRGLDIQESTKMATLENQNEQRTLDRELREQLAQLSHEDRVAMRQTLLSLGKMRQENPNVGSFVALLDPNDPNRIKAFFNPKTGKTVEPPMDAMKTPPSSAAMEKTANLESMSRDIELVEQTYGKAKGQFGPISGRLGRLKTATLGNTPEFSDVTTLTDNLADQLLRARSGAQINEKEFDRLRQLIPNVNDPVPTFERRLALFKRELNNIRKLRGAAGIATPGQETDDPLGIR